VTEIGGARARRPVVLLDARMARRRRTGGTRYIRGLVATLRARHGDDVDLRVAWGPPPLPRRNALTGVGNLLLDLAWVHLCLPVLAARHRADLLHSPFNWAPLVSPCPRVVTVLDLSFERTPERYPAGFRRYARLFTRLSARRARRVVAISQATAADVTAWYGVPPGRIDVVYIGADGVGGAPVGTTGDPAGAGADPPPRAPLILCVGEMEPRKRVPDVAEGATRYAARATAAGGTPWRLAVVGAGGSDEPRVRALAAASGGAVEIRGAVDDRELTALYRRAGLLIAGSTDEGFGLPVAEAALHGCPVLVADTPALREAGGPDALVIAGDGPDAVAAALESACADPAALARRGERARRHAARFSWAACGEGTVAAYRRALEGP
jgi:glycosyltransferase involved in cell wall biosynthesis